MIPVTCVAIIVVVGVLSVWSGARRARIKADTVAASLHLLEVELDRRREVIPELVGAAVSADLDRSAINQVVGARSWSIAVRDQNFDLSRRAAAENGLSVALHEIMFAARTHPRLRGNWEFQRPATELDRIEERVAGAVRVYNSNALALARAQRWPLSRYQGIKTPEFFVETTTFAPATESVGVAA